MLLAHKTYDLDGNVVCQSLKEHSEHTALYAQQVLSKFPYTASFCGIGHDLGKAKSEFQDYLNIVFEHPERSKDLRGSVNHTFAFVIWILEHAIPQNDDVFGICQEILAYVVGAHHGLFDLCDEKGFSGLAHRLNYDKAKIHYAESLDLFYKEVMPESMLDDLFDKALNELYSFVTQMVLEDSEDVIYFNISALCRMLLSGLVYGDRLDTMLFMTQSEDRRYVVKDGWKEACEFFERKNDEFKADSELNLVRQNISEQCLQAASRPCGIYRLKVPTGGGKTLSSFRYSLHHANLFGKKRIIYALPRLSILSQNVKAVRQYYVNPNEVLEHHSDVVNVSSKHSTNELSMYELLTTGWDSPVVFTTTVQFLNVLFSGDMSAVGRFAALSDSVVILDEVQDIPRRVTYMFNQMLNFLATYFNCTVILCSATQPSFDCVRYPLKYAGNADLVCLTDNQKNKFRRTTIVDKTCPYGISLAELSSFCEELWSKTSSLMCICNTRKQANSLYNLLKAKNLENTKLLHISNNMCKNHINDVLNESIEMLHAIQNGTSTMKLVLIATQIPEAGVDVSFEKVIRCLAGLDNAVQSDGRANRSWEYGWGYTYLVNLNAEDEHLQHMPEIKDKQSAMKAVLANQKYSNDLLSDEAISYYYRVLFHQMSDCDLGYKHNKYESLFGLLNNERNVSDDFDFDLTIPFGEIGQAFHAIEGQTFSIIVPYGSHKDDVKLLKETLDTDKFNFRFIYKLLNDLKLCVVSVYENQLNKLKQSGLLYSYLDDSILILDESLYSDETGLKIELIDNNDVRGDVQ